MRKKEPIYFNEHPILVKLGSILGHDIFVSFGANQDIERREHDYLRILTMLKNLFNPPEEKGIVMNEILTQIDPNKEYVLIVKDDPEKYREVYQGVPQIKLILVGDVKVEELESAIKRLKSAPNLLDGGAKDE